MKKLLEVNKGKLILEGVEWRLFARVYPKNQAKFLNDDDEIIIIDTNVLKFVRRDLKSRGANYLQDQRKVNQ